MPSFKRLGILAAAALLPLMAGGLIAAPAHADAASECADTSSTGGPIAGCMAAARAQQWLDANGGQGVRYSMDVGSSGFGRYRADCSGFVSFALHISDTTPTDGGLVTGDMYEANGFVDVAKDNLQQGDILDNPSAGADGHVVLFDHWADSAHTSYWGWEQHGPAGEFGTAYRVIQYPYDPGAGTFYPQHYTKLTPPPTTSSSHLYGLGPDKNYVAEWDGAAGKWHTIGGPATELYAGDAGLFAISPSDGSINQYTGSGTSWVKIGGPGAQFAEDNGHLYGLGPDKNYVAEWDGSPNKWHTIGGPATAIYAGDAGLFATSPSDGSISRYTGSGSSWVKVGGPGAQFAVGNGHLYGLGPDKNYVAQWDGTPNAWHTIGGPATAIYAGGDGLFATSPSDGSINRYTGSGASWAKVGGPGAQFTVGADALYAIGPNNAYVATWKTSWATIGGPASQIVVGK
jgi:hypothetical protein